MGVRQQRQQDGNALPNYAPTYAGAQALCIYSMTNAVSIVTTTVSG